MRKLSSPGTTSQQQQAWPRPTESAFLSGLFFYPRKDSATLHTSSLHPGWGLSPLSVPPPPSQPQSYLSPPTFCLLPVGGFLGVLSSVTSGRGVWPSPPPLRTSFGVLHSSPYLTTPFSDSLCFIWENEGLGELGIRL